MQTSTRNPWATEDALKSCVEGALLSPVLLFALTLFFIEFALNGFKRLPASNTRSFPGSE